jgi:hypothetical protein
VQKFEGLDYVSFRRSTYFFERPLLSKYCRWANFTDRQQRLQSGPSSGGVV